MASAKLLVLLPLLLLSASAAAHSGASVESVLSEIMSAQQAANAAGIDCNKVAEHQFEELGDALMEQMHPGSAHETMDAMMGGEGSEQLKAMHVSMGKSYLRCDGYAAMMGTGMMGSGMMGTGVSGQTMPYGTMGQGSYGAGMMYPGMLGSSAFWQGTFFAQAVLPWVSTALLAALVVAVVYLAVQIRGMKGSAKT